MNDFQDKFKKSPIKYRLYVLALLLLIIIILFQIPSNKKIINKHIASELPNNNYLSVVEIIDGDTFKLSDSSIVRLIGVDTPEKGQPFYDDAVALAESLLINNQIKLIYDQRQFDNYNRVLAYVRFDSIIYNELILERGFANVYLFSENTKWRKRLISAQKQARINEIGIWSNTDIDKEDYYIRIEGSFRFHRLLCPSIKNSKPSRKLKIFNKDNALDLGYSPCRNCRP
jgi:endonuclease YncB( thermonuclease family)